MTLKCFRAFLHYFEYVRFVKKEEKNISLWQYIYYAWLVSCILLLRKISLTVLLTNNVVTQSSDRVKDKKDIDKKDINKKGKKTETQKWKTRTKKNNREEITKKTDNSKSDEKMGSHISQISRQFTVYADPYIRVFYASVCKVQTKLSSKVQRNHRSITSHFFRTRKSRLIINPNSVDFQMMIAHFPTRDQKFSRWNKEGFCTSGAVGCTKFPRKSERKSGTGEFSSRREQWLSV